MSTLAVTPTINNTQENKTSKQPRVKKKTIFYF